MPAAASDKIGENCVVALKVKVGTTLVTGDVALVPEEDEDFKIIISKQGAEQLEKSGVADLQGAYVGKRIEVTGKVATYKARNPATGQEKEWPAIIVESAKQIQEVDSAKTPIGLDEGIEEHRQAGEVDAVTFMRAFVENRTDKFDGFLVEAGGAVLDAGSKVGEGGYAYVLVCGIRPDGTYYAIEKTEEDNYNFDGFRDRVLAVKLVWREDKMPEGYESGRPKFVLNMEELCQRFRARFEGEYDEATISQSGQSERKEKVPVLVWERPRLCPT